MTRLRTSDLEAVLTFLGEAESIDGPVPFTTALLDRLAELMRCEYATYEERDNLSRIVVDYTPCTAENELELSDVTDEDWEEWQASPFRAFKRAHVGQAVKLSDLLSRRSRRELSSFADWGTLDELFVYLAPPGSSSAFIHLESSNDFSERDRSVFQLLLPHLTARRRNAQTERRLATALAALKRDETDGVGVLLLDEDGTVTFASSAASRLIRHYFDLPAERLPGPIELWRENGRGTPLVVQQHGRRLVVESADGGSALVLTDQPASALALTPRQREVMRCIAAGLSNAETARMLWIQPGTVRKHLEHVYDKLGVRTRTAALAKLYPKAGSPDVNVGARRADGP
jgi:DNA-binding CsgD family transcriptional regulator/PAS domain-containing protein